MSYTQVPIITEIPSDNTDSTAVASRLLPQNISRIGFTKVLSNSVDPDWGAIVGSIGTGMDVDQTGGNLVITTGTTARSETIIRSTSNWMGGIRLKVRNTLSQRIVNQNFFVELVDVIGDSLAYSIGSATAITVTIPGHTFNSENIGQSMYIGGFSGTGTFLSGRYPIASIAGNDITFTVSSFAVGTGTCSIFGWNYYQLQYQGATATAVNFDTQRNGWASGVTAATINTTASPGHLAILTANDLVCTFSDQLVASASAVAVTPRASRAENVPDDVQLRLQVRVQNLGTAPASNTTWTIGLISISNFAPQDVSLQDIRPMTVATALPVDIVRTVVGPTQPVSGTAAHSAAVSGNPVYTAGKVAPTTIATVDTTLVAGDTAGTPVTTGQQVVIKPYGTAELDYTFLANPTVTTTTIQPLVLASGTASVRNYITSLTIQTDTIGAAGSMFIVDGQGAIGTSVTIATPGVFTSTAHDLKVGDCIIFTSIGTITGIAVNTQYWITATSFAATTFTIATSQGGSAIQITGSTSAFTFYRVLQLVRIPTTAITIPVIYKYETPIRTIANGAANVLIPSSLTSGAIYLTVGGYRGF